MSGSTEQPPLLQRLSTLADVARLRVLRLLDRQELSVGELARVLQLPQSTVSRHLKQLHDGHWVIKRSEGTASLYRLSGDALDAQARDLWALARAQMGTSPTFLEDDARLEEVLAERRTDSKAFFGRVGGEWDALRRELFGEHFTVHALLSLIPSEAVVADLGCGTGNAAELLAPQVSRVIAVDREPAMLDAARRRLANLSNVEFRQGELTALPIADASLDAALVVLVLHHVENPAAALPEVARALRPGGSLLIVDMLRHDRQTYRHTMGHQHLGFEEREVKSWAKSAGFTGVRFRRLRPDTESKGPGLFAATMRRA